MPTDLITLPADADGLLKSAARSMFDTFAQTAMGMLRSSAGCRCATSAAA